TPGPEVSQSGARTAGSARRPIQAKRSTRYKAWRTRAQRGLAPTGAHGGRRPLTARSGDAGGDPAAPGRTSKGTQGGRRDQQADLAPGKYPGSWILFRGSAGPGTLGHDSV